MQLTNDELKLKLQIAVDEMNKIYLKHLPNGYSNMKVTQIVGSPFGSISIGMIKELDDCPNRIRDNDKAKGHYMLHFYGDTYQLEKNYHSISENPRQQYYAMHLEKIPFRKITDKDLSKFLAKFEKHIIKFKEQLKDAIDNNRLYEQKTVKEIYLKLD